MWKKIERLASATVCGTGNIGGGAFAAGGGPGWFQGSGSRRQSLAWHPKKREERRQRDHKVGKTMPAFDPILSK